MSPRPSVRAIESGSVDPRHFDILGQDWDVEAQAEEVLRGLDSVGGHLSGADLARPAVTLSGGEAMDSTAELYQGVLRVSGGGYSQWRDAAEVEQAAALQAESVQDKRTRARSHRSVS